MEEVRKQTDFLYAFHKLISPSLGEAGPKGEAGTPGRFGYDGWPGLKGERGDDGLFGEVILYLSSSFSTFPLILLKPFLRLEKMVILDLLGFLATEDVMDLSGLEVSLVHVAKMGRSAYLANRAILVTQDAEESREMSETLDTKETRERRVNAVTKAVLGCLEQFLVNTFLKVSCSRE